MADLDIREDHEGLARHDHQATSKTAAIDVFPRSGTQRWKVFATITYVGDHGATRDEIAIYLGMSQNTVRPRVKELIDGGWVITNGQTRPTQWQHQAEVLVLTAKGLAKAAELRYRSG